MITKTASADSTFFLRAWICLPAASRAAACPSTAARPRSSSSVRRRTSASKAPALVADAVCEASSAACAASAVAAAASSVLVVSRKAWRRCASANADFDSADMTVIASLAGTALQGGRGR